MPVSSISITLPARPGTSTADWTAGGMPLMIRAQATLENGKVPGLVQESRILVTIKSSGSKVCGSYSPQTAPSSQFSTASKTWSGQDVLDLLGTPCTLKPGAYEFCVQFFSEGSAARAISEEICRPFLIQEPDRGTQSGTQPPIQITAQPQSSGQQSGRTYTGPQNTAPADEKALTLKEAKQPLRFSWLPVTPPPPAGDVVYTLRVYYSDERQAPSQAMKTMPVLEQELKTTQTFWQIPPEIAGQKGNRRFIWNVQATGKDGRGYGNNNGISEPTVFKILDDNINIKIDSVHVGCCEGGKQSIYILVTNSHPGNQAQITAIRYRVNGTGPLTLLSPVIPALPFTMSASTSQAFTGSVSCIDSMKTIKFIVDAIWPTDPDNINNETAWDTLKCRCDACDEKKTDIKIPPATSLVINANGLLTQTQPITIVTTPAKMIRSVKAELVYFEFVPESDDCLPCNRDSKTFGNFSSGTLAATAGSGSGTHTLLWNYNPYKNFSGGQTASLTITLPPVVPCCAATIRWCIRYVITFDDCTTCHKMACYEKKKEGCGKGDVVPHNDAK